MSSTTLAKKAKKLNISRKSGVRRIVNVSRSRKWENQLRVSQELASKYKTVLLRTFDRLVFRKTRTLWLFLETDPVILGSKFGKNTHLSLIILSCDSGTSSERQDSVGRTAGLATVFQGGDLSLRLKPQTPLSALWSRQRLLTSGWMKSVDVERTPAAQCSVFDHSAPLFTPSDPDLPDDRWWCWCYVKVADNLQ